MVRDADRPPGPRRAAAGEAADLLRERLPDVFGQEVQEAQEAQEAQARLVPGGAVDGPLLVEGFAAEDLAVLLVDGHRMVGPVLGPVRARLLAEPALDAGTVLEHGSDPFAPDLIRLPGVGGQLRLPRFQFTEDVRPRPVVREVNALLAADRDPWGAADWWLSANAWLGTSPVRLLGTGGDRRLVDVAGFLLESE